MGNGDWYRNENWNDQIERTFFEKLKRSKSQRTQYVKIQTFYLLDKYPNVVIRLIQYARENIPDEIWEQDFCLYESRAYYVLKKYDKAIEKVYESIEWRKRTFGYRSDNLLWASELCLQIKRSSEYQKCFDLLKELHEETPFPLTEYRFHAYSTLLLYGLEKYEEAKKEALLAKSYADKNINDLQNSVKQGIGIVNIQKEWSYIEIFRILQKQEKIL